VAGFVECGVRLDELRHAPLC